LAALSLLLFAACSTPLSDDSSAADAVAAGIDASAPPMPAPGTIGAPCVVDGDCAIGQCATNGYPGGYCTLRHCDPDAEPCPAGSNCIILRDGSGMNVSSCMEDCTTASQCRPGYSCCTRASNGESWCDQPGGSSPPSITCSGNP
jgi:hypothetical protein